MPPSPLAAVARRLRPPPAGTDADLLDRFRLARDEAAFAALVQRHAGAVRAVARARLGNPADADDVAQATFLVLARDAAKVRESVAGFLVRVAHLTALQHRRNLARRRTDPLPEGLPMHADPADAAVRSEHKAVVTEELAGLPDRLRVVVVLCCLEGLTAAGAATRLGVPKGTVDSRLATAKRRLVDRLARRGLAAGAGAVALDALAAEAAVAGPSDAVFAITQAALEYAAAGGGLAPTPVSLLADGVSYAMTGPARLFALGMVAVALSGSAGVGLYRAAADEQPPAPAKPVAKPAEPPQAASAAGPSSVPAARAPVTDEAGARAALAMPAPPDVSVLNVGTLFDLLFEQYGLVVRIDMAACERLLPFPEDRLNTLYDTKLRTARTRGMTVADLLAEVATTFGNQERQYAFRVRGGQVLLGPAYRVPSLPGSGGRPDFTPMVMPEMLAEQVVGPPVSVAITSQPLAGAVEQLRRLTGANIVLDARAKEAAKQDVAGSFDDVRLLTVLQVLGDMAGLKPVTLNNVYYLTTPENAAPLQKLADRDLHGPLAGGGLGVGGQPPAVAIPAGFVTDGYQYFPRTADMKPVDPRAVGALGTAGLSGAGLGGGMGTSIAPLPGTLPVPAPAAPPPAVPEKR
jgi:RNA polymerase sigma factor (sigma-70 family)